ncbi:hypothetical protein HDU97_009160 [Phlyctochytrium planicorne]|nr:hypothetical protein HDU97_009160 [Phlyctochytrium planicorne]
MTSCDAQSVANPKLSLRRDSAKDLGETGELPPIHDGKYTSPSLHLARRNALNVTRYFPECTDPTVPPHTGFITFGDLEVYTEPNPSSNIYVDRIRRYEGDMPDAPCKGFIPEPKQMRHRQFRALPTEMIPVFEEANDFTPLITVPKDISKKHPMRFFFDMKRKAWTTPPPDHVCPRHPRGVDPLWPIPVRHLPFWSRLHEVRRDGRLFGVCVGCSTRIPERFLEVVERVHGTEVTFALARYNKLVKEVVEEEKVAEELVAEVLPLEHTKVEDLVVEVLPSPKVEVAVLNPGSKEPEPVVIKAEVIVTTEPLALGKLETLFGDEQPVSTCKEFLKLENDFVSEPAIVLTVQVFKTNGGSDSSNSQQRNNIDQESDEQVAAAATPTVAPCDTIPTPSQTITFAPESIPVVGPNLNSNFNSPANSADFHEHVLPQANVPMQPAPVQIPVPVHQQTRHHPIPIYPIQHAYPIAAPLPGYAHQHHGNWMNPLGWQPVPQHYAAVPVPFHPVTYAQAQPFQGFQPYPAQHVNNQPGAAHPNVQFTHVQHYPYHPNTPPHGYPASQLVPSLSSQGFHAPPVTATNPSPIPPAQPQATVQTKLCPNRESCTKQGCGLFHPRKACRFYPRCKNGSECMYMHGSHGK